MIRTVSLTMLTLLLGACATVDCSRSFCGCSSPTSEALTVRLADADGSPVGNARLICHDDGAYLGMTNPQGILSLTVKGSASPGCGFVPDCKVAYFRNSDDSFGRHFWFARFVRGEDVSSRAHSVERLDRSN